MMGKGARAALEAARRKAGEERLRRLFLLRWEAAGGPVLVEEYRFHGSRMWRFDFAHPESRVAIELEGGVWSQGRHVRGRGFEGDCEKYNEAALEGWRVFRFTERLLCVGFMEKMVVRLGLNG